MKYKGLEVWMIEIVICTKETESLNCADECTDSCLIKGFHVFDAFGSEMLNRIVSYLSTLEGRQC